MSENKLSGSCFCGKAEYEVENTFQSFQICHCKQCQLLSGSAFRSHLYIELNKFRWVKGSGFVKRYRHREQNFSHAFCMECGSDMPLESVDGKTVCIPAGSLADSSQLKQPIQLYWHEHADWFDLLNSAKKSAENSNDYKTPFL